MHRSKEIKAIEAPSVMMISNARSLGKLAAIMANRGSLGEEKLISEETWETFHSEPKEELMNDILPTVFSKGGCNHFGFEPMLKTCNPQTLDAYSNLNSGREGFIGWIGFGGSVMQWHPECKVGFAYVPFDYIDVDAANKRGAEI